MNVLLVQRSVAIIQSSAVAAHGDARQLFPGVRCGSEAKAAQLDAQAYSKWLQVRKEIELSTWLPKQHSIGYKSSTRSRTSSALDASTSTPCAIDKKSDFPSLGRRFFIVATRTKSVTRASTHQAKLCALLKDKRAEDEDHQQHMCNSRKTCPGARVHLCDRD